MTGGLIQLVAYGIQDLFLTKDPQITFFKVVYRRHTNFSTEVIPQSFTSTANFGKRVSCILSRNGDLIGKTHLVVTLPQIPFFKNDDGSIDNITKFAWIRRIGYGLIKNIEVEIGSELIDRQYGDWLNIWHELNIINSKNLNKILGNVQELYDFSNGKKSYKLFIPLKFWFNRFPGLALPVICLQYNNIKINLEMNDSDQCYITVPTHTINIDNDLVNFEPFEFIQQNVDGVISLARYIHFDIVNRTLYLWRYTNNGFLSVTETDPNKIKTEQQQRAILYAKDTTNSYINGKYFITGLTTLFQAMPRINATERTYSNKNFKPSTIIVKEAFLLVEYIFLDTEERVRFAQGKHEYLIEQLLYNGESTVDGINQSFKIGFTQPCIEVFWVTQLALAQNTRINDVFNYTDSLVRLKDGSTVGNNIILNETILFNGLERISLRDSSYFNWAQPYQNHSHSPAEGINTYSFALYPEKHQPSCTANMSKLDSILLRLVANQSINFNYTAKLRIYGMVYNVLRIVSGISGLVFSNDAISM
jgi:hypothetical protein